MHGGSTWLWRFIVAIDILLSASPCAAQITPNGKPEDEILSKLQRGENQLDNGGKVGRLWRSRETQFEEAKRQVIVAV